MASKRVVYKKEEIREYVSGQMQIKSQLVESSSLRNHSRSTPFRLYPHPGFMLLATGLITLGLVLLHTSDKELSLSNYTGILGLISLTLGVVNLQYLFSNFYQNLVKYRDSLLEPVEEVIYLKEYLATYLKNLDYRTRKYFSLITDNKVSNYLLLTNILSSLQEKLYDIESLLGHSGKKNLMALDSLLRGSITISDGIDKTSGHLFKIHFENLAENIDVLIANMENSIKELESEIRRDKYFEQDFDC